MLLVFDLNGVLGHVNKNVKTFNQYGIYNQTQTVSRDPNKTEVVAVKPVFEDNTVQVFARPNLHYINYELLLKSKKEVDIGVWSSQDRDNTQQQVKHLFGRFLSQLLFVSFDPTRTHKNESEALDVRSQQMARNLSSVF